MHSILLFAVSSLILFISPTTASSCGLCLPVGPPYDDLYLVTRLWSINSSTSWTDLDVIEEFNKGFAPLVTSLPGFIQYTAAQNDYNSSTVYFSNVFASAELAHAAQEAAKQFVNDGALNDVIVPYHFTESKVAFDIAADECVDTPHTDMYLNTRLYKVISTNDELTPDALRKDTAPLADSYAKQTGFVNYVGTITEDGEYLFFSNVFDDLDSSHTANSMGTASANNTDEGDSSLLVATEGRIVFDYICAGGNSTANETIPMSDLDNTIESTVSPTSASVGSVAMMLSESVIVACIWLSARMLH